MKFLCPNCKAKYRIGPEKMVGRQAAKIRCRKCEYLIQIAYRPNSDEFDVTATPPTVPPPSTPPPLRAPKASSTASGQPVMPSVATASNVAGVGSRGRAALAAKEEGIASKKPTAAVPGLPGLGSPKSRSGAALLSDPSGLVRRPLAPLPPPPVPPLAGASGLGGAGSGPNAAQASAGAASSAMASPPPSVPPPSPPPALGASYPGVAPARGAGSTQLADQFRESVQAGGAAEDLPQEGWFVGVNGVPLGPIPLGDLRELAMAGHIDRRSLVWRDGQPEWRPLGKFPGLARVIDDGAPPASPRVEPAPTPVASRTNGANGHMTGGPMDTGIATGFDVPRADAGERPSAWGDLDDDDDDDEQPTTVKGRVSVMPAGAAQPSVVSLPAPPAPAALSPGASNPFGITSAQLPQLAPAPVPPSGAPPVASAPPGGAPAPAMSEPAAPVSIISAMPDSMGDADDSLRPRGRSKWYLIAVALVFAFVLGAIVTHLMRASSSEKTSSDSSSPSPSGAREKAPYADGQLAPEGASARAAGEARGAHPEAITAALRPADIGRAEDLGGARALAPGLAEASTASTTSATGSLLSGLGSPRAPGPSLARGGRAAGSGLDATAIQRTVRRYSPAVRQNCWLRAIEARPPGVPTSVKLTATITVEAGGRVQGVAVSGAPRGYPTLSRCVEGAVKSWQFPRSGAPTITNVPFMFMGQ